MNETNRERLSINEILLQRPGYVEIFNLSYIFGRFLNLSAGPQSKQLELHNSCLPTPALDDDTGLFFSLMLILHRIASEAVWRAVILSSPILSITRYHSVPSSEMVFSKTIGFACKIQSIFITQRRGVVSFLL
jgi:hypothetical protein